MNFVSPPFKRGKTLNFSPISQLSTQDGPALSFTVSAYRLCCDRHFTRFQCVSSGQGSALQFEGFLRDIMASRSSLPLPDMIGCCEGSLPLFGSLPADAYLLGCGGSCHSKSSCSFLHVLHDTACKKFHCQACLMPLSHQQGINMHPSCPGWRSCTFRYKEVVARYLVLASLGVHIKATLPSDFPVQGPESAMDWAFTCKPGYPPNIVFFVGALLGLK